jgi:hypothetical protein
MGQLERYLWVPLFEQTSVEDFQELTRFVKPCKCFAETYVSLIVKNDFLGRGFLSTWVAIEYKTPWRDCKEIAQKIGMRKGFVKFTLLLSVLVAALNFVCHERFFDHSDIDVTLPEYWKRISTQEKLDSLDGLLSKDAPFFLLSEIKQFKIRRQLKKMIVNKEDEVLRDGFHYSFGFRYYLGWEELGLLGLAGFASIWVLYFAVRVIILLVPATPMIHCPSPALSGRIEFLNFHTGYKPASLLGVKITLFNFLVLEEGPKRPAKPAAVWID